MQFENEFFGSKAQQTVSRRARDLWRFCSDDKRFAYNGRIVTIVGDIGPETGETLSALARLQGSCTCHYLPKTRVEAIQSTIESADLSSNLWEFCTGGQGVYDAARQVLKTHSLPTDLIVEQLTVDTDAKRMTDFAALATECGVLPMAGRVVRGLDIPGITLVAIDADGNTVGSAWGYKCYPVQSDFSDYVFWGGLTCREDRRGQKIALVLGAISIVQLWENLGVRGFGTGIVAGNTASFSLCEKLGVLPSDWVALGVTDPSMFHGGSLTK